MDIDAISTKNEHQFYRLGGGNKRKLGDEVDPLCPSMDIKEAQRGGIPGNSTVIGSQVLFPVLEQVGRFIMP